MKTAPLLLILFFLSASAMANNSGIAYKCTAEDGRVSFLDKRPSEGCVTIEEVKIGGASDKNQSSLEDLSKEQADRDKQAIAEREEQNKKICTKHEETLKVLKSQSRIILTDPATGQKKPLSPEEQQIEINKHEAYIQNFCTPKTVE